MSVLAMLALERGVVECGGAVTGVAGWSGNTRHLQVGVILRYWTQGRGDTDAAVAGRYFLGLDETGRAGFRIDVPPQGPVTYNGQLLRLVWQAMICIPVTRVTGRSGLAVANLTVVPRGWLLLPPPSGQPSPSGRPDG